MARHPVRLMLACAVALAAAAAQSSAAAAADVVPGRVVVRFSPSATGGQRTAARGGVDATIVDTVAPRTQVLDVPDGTVRASVRELGANPHVAWAEPSYVVHALDTVPDDPSFPDQWAWSNSGQYAGTPGVDIEAPRAWDISQGSGALVAIVDTGVLAGNADFAGAIWDNPHPGDGRCVDASVSDLHGCDFVNGDGDPTDDHHHGTAVASEVGARMGDGVGMAGVAPQSRLMPVKVLDSGGSGYSDTVAAGLSYAADHGAKIVNVSIGGPESQVEYDAIASHPDTLYVVAAGNYTSDDDDPAQATYPCAESLANVLCVGASTNIDAIADFSNWGHATVDLMAPGQWIQGVNIDTGTIGLWSGTSMAAPLTTGVAALLLAHKPSATGAQIKQAIMTAAVPVAGFADKTVSGGRLDAYRALQALDTGAPAPANTVRPAVAGSPVDTNHTLTATAGAWTGATSTSLQWQRCTGASGTGCQDITGAVAATYRPVAADDGFYLRVVETAANASGTATARSDAVGPVRAVPGVVFAPTITSSPAAAIGATLFGDVGSWSNDPTSVTLAWERCDGAGASCATVGDGGPSYVLHAADVGHTMRLKVTASNARGATVSETAPTGVVADGAPVELDRPVLTGDASVGGLVSVSDGSWDSVQAPAIARRWQRCDAVGTSCADIPGATGATYAPAVADAGSTLRARIAATNPHGSTSDVSAPSPVVVLPPPAAPVNVSPPAPFAPTVGVTPTVAPVIVAPRPASAPPPARLSVAPLEPPTLVDTGGPAAPAAPVTAVGVPTTATVTRGTAKLRVRCDRACSGTVRVVVPGVRGAPAEIGTASLRLTHAGTTLVAVRLGRRARALTSTRRLRATVEVTIGTQVSRRTITLRAAARRPAPRARR